MKKIMVIGLIFVLLLSSCNFTENEKEILKNKADGIEDQFYLDMVECFVEILNITEYQTVDPYYKNTKKIIKKYTDNLKKLNNKEKEILQTMISLLENDKKYIENDFSVVYLEQSSKYIDEIIGLMANNKE